MYAASAYIVSQHAAVRYCNTEQGSMLEKAKKLAHVATLPLVKLLVKLNVAPNVVTTIGLMVNVIAASVFIVGAECGSREDFSYIGLASALILLAGVFDILDGQVARIGESTSKYGALYDSVIDRYSELIMFLGICYYFVSYSYLLSSLFAFVAMIGSIMVSYTRARAQGVGIECEVGLMQRPARIIVIGISGLICSITATIIGSGSKLYIGIGSVYIAETITIYALPIGVVALLSNLTAIRRLIHCRKQLL